MKKYNLFLFFTALLLASCQTPQKENYEWLKKSLDTFTFAVLNITTKYKCIFEK